MCIDIYIYICTEREREREISYRYIARERERERERERLVRVPFDVSTDDVTVALRSTRANQTVPQSHAGVS